LGRSAAAGALSAKVQGETGTPVAVGFIALTGVAAVTGVVMLIYLNHALAEIKPLRATEGRALTRGDLYDAIMEGAVERVRPKMMTVGRRHHGGPAADHAEHRDRLRDHAAHRGADGRGHGLLDAADADRDSGDLRFGQGFRLPSEHFVRGGSAEQIILRSYGLGFAGRSSSPPASPRRNG
jgi:hypothetical protein